MANGTQPGDGRNSPFGNGAGGPGEPMAAPNDFTRNPAGTGARQAGTDFSKQSRQQQAAGQRTNTADAAPGPATAAEVANRPGAGVGSIGNGARPFKLGGV